jgi:hypothetical protein
MRMTLWGACALVATSIPVLAACGNSSSTGGTGASTSASQTPPMGETALKAWLATGAYKSWHCEPTDHVAVAPSPHSQDRVCSNDLLAAGSPPFPQGAAAVKELYDKPSSQGGVVFGYAVYLKTQASSAAGANWYWYEDNPTLDPDGGVVADGLGNAGNPMTICVSCHNLAGSDSAHMGAGDEVYTQVK